MNSKQYLVSIYRNIDKCLIIIPNKNTSGFYTNALPFEKLEYYDSEDIGRKVKRVFQQVINNEIFEADSKRKVFQMASNIASFKSFSKKHLLVNVFYFEDEKNYSIKNWVLMKDGSYGEDKDTGDFISDFRVSENTSNIELGDTILKAFEEGEKYIDSKNKK